MRETEMINMDLRLNQKSVNYNCIPYSTEQQLRNHVGRDGEWPHRGPGGDPGVQLQQGQQAPGPHYAVPDRGRGGPHGGGDAEMV